MRARGLVLCVALGACAPASAPAPPTARADTVPQLDLGIPHDSAREAAIVAEMGRSTALHDLEYLSSVIGPRLTGSAELRRATDWAAQRLRALGADSVWLEEVRVERGWERGRFSMRLTAPHARPLQGASVGWAPGTNGRAEGDVVLVDARDGDDFRARFAGRMRGAWVIVETPGAESEAFAASRDSLLAAEGIAGTIRSSGKGRGLLSMSGSPLRVPRVAGVIVAQETFEELRRLVARGERARIEADIENRFTPAFTAHNVLAELRGRLKPDEIVLLGAHLDSWDLATGATDNGAGVVAVVDALRAIAVTGGRPARTVRVALFVGEEQGLLGSLAYVDRHRASLWRHQAVLVVDNGSGRISGIALQGRDDLRSAWERLLRPLAPVGPFTIESRVRTGSDHLPFLRAGVPAYLFNQEWRSYDWTWHTQADSYEHVVADELPQIGTVMAVVAWGFASAERLVPRRGSAP